MDIQTVKDRPLVLVVDDEESMRFLVTESLDAAGFDVVEAGDGEEGLRVFEENRPDIILMDVMMPGMDGFETCAEVRKKPGGAHVPVLMITGLDDVESINKAYSAGATDFIAKPINYDLLGHRVRYLMRSSDAINALVTSERRLATAQRIARMGYWDWNASGEDICFSEQASRILGLPDGGTVSFDTFFSCVPDEDRGKVQDWFELARTSGDASNITHRVISSDGTDCYIRQQVEALCEQEQVAHMYGTIQDITELRQAEERIHRLAYYDSLTGLPNRAFFKERVDSVVSVAKRHDRQLALLFLDLNNFKRINDSLGHSVGDLLLQATADRLIQSLRASDLVHHGHVGVEKSDLARLGGDEFTILLPEIQQSGDAGRVAERVIEVLCQPLTLAGHEVSVSTSVGIAVYPHDGEDAETLLKNADMAMYYAKRKVKDLYQYFNQSMNEDALRRLTLEGQLRVALDNDEFTLYYQPQLDVVSGRLSGVEALLRWDNKKLGRVMPEDFIPLAEETGLIIPIGEWVLRTACQQAKAWQTEGNMVPRIAVNVSAVQFMEPGFPELVFSVLEETKLEPCVLELEVTEGILMKDAEYAIEILDTLKGYGVQIAIDDFGTGYSSLSYLKQFPIDRLKIDKVFVRDINTDTDDAAIATAVIAMAGSMDLKVIAEGVETQDQLSFLQNRQCDEVQGFYLSEPMPASEMRTYISDKAALESENVVVAGDRRAKKKT